MVMGLQMTSQRLMTEVLIDTGVNSTVNSTTPQPPEPFCYTTPSPPCYVYLLIFLGLLQGVIACCHERFVVPGSDSGGFMPE